MFGSVEYESDFNKHHEMTAGSTDISTGVYIEGYTFGGTQWWIVGTHACALVHVKSLHTDCRWGTTY